MDLAQAMTPQETIARLQSQLDECRKELEKAQNDCSTIDQRDRAEEAADLLAATILSEDIDWADHDAKWREALETVTPEATVAQLRTRLDTARDALKGIEFKACPISDPLNVVGGTVQACYKRLDDLRTKARAALASLREGETP